MTHGFPAVYVLFMSGFLIMLAIDQVFFKTTTKKMKAVENKATKPTPKDLEKKAEKSSDGIEEI